MFSWFKKRLNVLLPNDINNGFMTANLCTVKTNSKIIIPKNVIGFVSYKDKVYLEMPEGEYTINKENLPDLYKRQGGNKRTLKHIKLDFFFINTKAFDINFSYTDKIPVNAKNVKFKINVALNCGVINVNKFYDFVLGFLSTTSAVETESLIVNFTQEFLMKQFLKLNLTDINLPDIFVSMLEEKLIKFMEKMSLKLNTFKISIEPKLKAKNNTYVSEQKKSSFFEPLEESLSANVDQSTKDDYNTNNIADSITINVGDNVIKQQPEQFSKPEICPFCSRRLISGSAFCHRCGNKIK